VREPRGRIVLSTKPVYLGDAVVCGRKPTLVVYIRAGSSKHTRNFHRFCQFHGLHVTPVQEVIPGRPDAFEVLGTMGSLERLTSHPAVVRFHYALNVRPNVRAGGGGEMTDNARKAVRESRMHKPDRLAAEENARRARLPREEQLDLELHDARQLAAAL
jgi:hypothetical protein